MQPHKALRTRTCAAHHERGEELVPGDAAWGVVGAKEGARPLPAYDGSSHTTITRRGRHAKRIVPGAAHIQRPGPRPMAARVRNAHTRQGARAASHSKAAGQACGSAGAARDTGRRNHRRHADRRGAVAHRPAPSRLAKNARTDAALARSATRCDGFIPLRSQATEPDQSTAALRTSFGVAGQWPTFARTLRRRSTDESARATGPGRVSRMSHPLPSGRGGGHGLGHLNAVVGCQVGPYAFTTFRPILPTGKGATSE